MHTQGQQGKTIAWQQLAPFQLERHVTCQRGMAQQLCLFDSAVTSVGEISRDRYRGQSQTVIACNNLCEQLQLVQADDRVKAVVLRLDSPGRRRHQGMISPLLQPSMCSLSIWLPSMRSAMACFGQGSAYLSWQAICDVETILTSNAQGHVAQRACT